MLWELTLLAVFSVCWLLVFAAGVGWVSLAGTLSLGLYPLYSLAAALGWIAGNVFLHRAHNGYPPRLRKRLLLSYFLGPPGFFFALRVLAPAEVQQAAPLVPIYGFGVYTLFFMVPLTLRATRATRRGPGNR